MKKIIVLIMMVCFSLGAYAVPTSPTTISYQGVLTDGSDELVADGTYAVTFKLYDVSSGGTALWTETQSSVATVNGLFNVDLGSVTGVTGVDFTKQLYLEVTVGSTVLSPRIKFTAQPYAFIAKTITETLPIAKGGTGATTTQGAKDNLGISTLETDVNALETNYTTLDNKVTSIDNDVNTLQSDVNTLETNLSTLNNIVTSIDNDVNTLQSDVLDINKDITKIQFEIDKTNNEVDFIKVDLSNLNTDINVLETTVNGLGTLSTKSTINNTDWSGTALSLSNGGTGSSTVEGARTNLGLGTLSTKSTINNTDWSGEDLSLANGGTGASTVEGARTNLGLGTLSTKSTINNTDWSGEDLAITNGGTGSSTVEGARTNLGLGTLSTKSTINNTDWSGEDLSIINGGTGASDAAGARTNLGLGNISTQDSTNIKISGGKINGTTIGATTASTGKFTTLEATSFKLPGGTDGQVLTYNASTGNATWTDAASGGSGGGGGAELKHNIYFDHTLSSAGLGVIETLEVASTGKYLFTFNATVDNYSTGGYLNFELEQFINGGDIPVLTGGTFITGDQDSARITFSHVFELTSTGTLTLKGKGTEPYPIYGNFTLTKLTAPGGSGGGTVDLSTGVTGTLPLANGGTGATTEAGARTNLGLGTISTQAASNVAISGGAINGTTIGATTASTGKFTSLEATGFKLPTGAGDGKVLTSDANGTATWAAASGGSSLSMVYSETASSGNISTSFGQIMSSSTLSAGTYLVETNLDYSVNTTLELSIRAGSSKVSNMTFAGGITLDMYRGLTSIVTLSSSNTISVYARAVANTTFSDGLLKIVKLF